MVCEQLVCVSEWVGRAYIMRRGKVKAKVEEEIEEDVVVEGQMWWMDGIMGRRK